MLLDLKQIIHLYVFKQRNKAVSFYWTNKITYSFLFVWLTIIQIIYFGMTWVMSVKERFRHSYNFSHFPKMGDSLTFF